MAERYFRKIKVSTDNYFKITFKIYPFIQKVSNYYKIKIENIRYYHIEKYCKEVLDYEIGYMKKNGSVAGLTVINQETTFIMVNSHESISNGRIYFSLLHEITHSIIHRSKNDNKKQTFASMLNSSNAYSFEEKKLEIEADICASIMFANDYALMNELKKGKTFKQLVNEFKMSNQAMQTRLLNFLIYSNNFSFEQSKQFCILYASNQIDLSFLFCELDVEDYT